MLKTVLYQVSKVYKFTFFVTLMKVCNYFPIVIMLHCSIVGQSSIKFSKTKNIFVGDKLLLSYRSAASGLKENVLPCNFIQNVNIYYIILYVAQMLYAMLCWW